MRTIYACVNQWAKCHWYTHSLRSQGKHEKAREEERKSIRYAVGILRKLRDNKGFIVIHEGGVTFRYDTRATLDDHVYSSAAPLVEAAAMLGVTVLDITTVPVERLPDLRSLPIPHVGSPLTDLELGDYQFVRATTIRIDANEIAKLQRLIARLERRQK